MTDNNPSVVNDASGNNYGGISSGGSMGQANMQYLENLQRLAMKAPPKPLANDQYMPGIGQGIQVGTSSSQTLGSQPLFAARNLIPFAMLDEIKRSEAEAEAKYYAHLKPYLDKPLIDAKLKLANPFAQPEFANKLQKLTDTMLDKYADRFGGNYMQAYVALQQDKDFNRTMDGVANFISIYDNVYKTALKTVEESAHPQDFFVPESKIAAANKFIYTMDHIEDLSFENMAKTAQELQTKDSIFKLADALTDGVKTSVRAFFEKNPDVNMSTPEEEVWIRNKISGEGQADGIVESAKKMYPWIAKDPETLDLFTQYIKGKVPYSIEQEVSKVKAENADRNMALKKMGVDVQKDGSILFTSTVVPMTGGVGANAVSFNVDKVIPSSTGMDGRMLIKGKIRHVMLDRSYASTLKAEYDIGLNAAQNIPPGRYTEINVNLQSTDPYDVQKYYQLKGIPIPVGEARGGTQTVPATVRDVDTGEVYEIMGNQTILVDHTQTDKTVEANVQGMLYVHKQLQKQSVKEPYNRDREFLGRSPDSPIVLPPGGDMELIKDDPGIYYKDQRSGKTVSGSVLHELFRKQNKK